jgi:MFS family permease
MSARARVWLASACLGVFVAGAVGVAMTAILGGRTSSQQLALVAFLAYGVVGWIVVVRRPGNVVGWLLLASAAIGGVFGLCQTLSAYAKLRHSVDTWWGFLALWPQNWLWLPLVTVSTTLPVLLFPDGNLLSRRWRPVAVIAIVIAALYGVGNALAPTVGTAVDNSSRSNPLAPPFMHGVNPDDWWLNTVLLLGATAILILAAVSVYLRWRRARGAERLQMRWFLFGASALAAGFVLNITLPVPWRDLVLTTGFAFLPVCMGVAILRYRLYDIDRVVSRTVSYAIVTGFVLATYVVIVTSVSRVLGDTSPITVAGATLAAAALARPQLARVQRVVDRRFDRARSDAMRTVEEFGRRLGDQVDPDATTAELIGVIRRSMSPTMTSLWVRSE